MLAKLCKYRLSTLVFLATSTIIFMVLYQKTNDAPITSHPDFQNQNDATEVESSPITAIKDKPLLPFDFQFVDPRAIIDPDAPGQPTNHSARNILLVSVGRSGSSLVGAWLASAVRDSFYWFEPLHRVTHPRYGLPQNEIKDAAEQLFKSFFTCQYNRNLSLYLRLSSFGYRVMSGRKLLPRVTTERTFMRFCQQSELKLIKTIRINPSEIPAMTFPAVSRMLARLKSASPDLRIVVLVRDARDVALSTRKMRDFQNWETEDVCSWQYNSIKAAKSALPLEDLSIVRYEDLVSRPHETTTAAFNRLGLEISTETSEWILENLNGNHRHYNFDFPEVVQQVNTYGRYCNLVFKSLGYPP